MGSVKDIMAKHKPTLYVDEKDLPAIKDYDLGDTYYALYKCKVVSKEIEGDEVSGRLEVQDIKPIPHSVVGKIRTLIGGKRD